VADPDGFRSGLVVVVGEPDTDGVAAAEEGGGAIAGAGEVVGEDYDLEDLRRRMGQDGLQNGCGAD
jgi:hypothetical protein